MISAGVLTAETCTICPSLLERLFATDRALVGKLTGLRIQSLLDIEAKPEYRQDEPALEVKMTRKGREILSYHISKPEDASYYVLKRSDLDHYFEVAKYTANPIKETTGENLVQPRTEEASSEPPGDKRDEKDDDASADEEKESDAGGAPAEDEK